jgi:hypothetical protein
MRHALRDLNRATLASLTEALRSGHIRAPITRSMLAGYVPLGQLDAVLAALSAMEREGMTPRHIAHVVGMLAEERLEGQRMSDRVQFVWSPPELDRIDSRDTAVVVQDLFVQARSSVLISSRAATDFFLPQDAAAAYAHSRAARARVWGQGSPRDLARPSSS